MATVKVTDHENNVPQLVDAIGEVQGAGIRVGVMGKGGSTQQIKASVHEFGATIRITEKMRNYFAFVHGIWFREEKTHIHIPERQFIRPALDDNEAEIRTLVRSRMVQIAEGNAAPESLMPLVGETVKSFMQQQMGENGPPLSDMTLMLRRGGDGGGGNAVPLRDEGRLFQAIAWEPV